MQPSYGGGSEDAFAAEISPAGSAARWSTFLGGSAVDVGRGVALDPQGNLYVTGTTRSTDFPTTNSVQTSFRGAADAFLVKIAAASTGLVPWHPHATVSLAAGLSAAVDQSDGHVDVTAADMSVASRGLDPALQHTWDSTLGANGITTAAGQGWVTDLTQHIYQAWGGQPAR